MIKKLVPTLLLLLLGLICALACVGALTAAAIAWLSPHWGAPLAALAVAGVYLLIALIALAIVRMRHAGKSHPGPGPHELLDKAWENNAVTLMAVAGLATFLLVKKPSFITRILAATARSAGAVAMLRRLL